MMYDRDQAVTARPVPLIERVVQLEDSLRELHESIAKRERYFDERVARLEHELYGQQPKPVEPPELRGLR